MQRVVDMNKRNCVQFARVEAQQQRNEEARHNNIPEAEHGKLRVGVAHCERLGKYQLDGRVDVARNADHDGRAEHEEDVVEKQQRQ